MTPDKAEVIVRLLRLFLDPVVGISALQDPHDEVLKHWCIEGESYRQEAPQLKIVKDDGAASFMILRFGGF